MPQVTDPVCGMTIDSNSAPGTSKYQGITYYFCSDQCKERFDAKPGSFVDKSARARPDWAKRPEA